MKRVIFHLTVLSAATLNAAPLPANHAERMTRGLALFQKDVRPLLAEHCLNCHGGKKTKGDFDLATREGLLKGGTEGVGVVPFDVKASGLLKLVRHEVEPNMPDDKPKLPDDAIAKITEWIENGAPYDKPLIEGKKPARDRAVVTAEDKQWWAFLPLAKVTPPAGVAHPVDAFLSASAAKKGLKFAPAAAPRVLVRRVYLDLIGLPPTPEEVERFVQSSASNSQSALAALVDDLLARPQHGERWSRHWLDVARFAESSGFEHDYDRQGAFHYRDFVIKALNSDMPFDQFVRWQIAGDEYEPGDMLAMSATGFLGAGVFPTQITANEVERTRYDAMDDMLSTTASAFLGLTVGCARCHDHKYDPIPARDYYRMLSTFTTTVRSVLDLHTEVVETPEGKKPAGAKAKVLVCAEGHAPLRMHTQGADFFPETHILKRGSADMKEGVATQSFLQVLMPTADAEKQWLWSPPSGVKYSGRRRTFTNWLTDVEHGAGALTARVIVNRLWQHHFGTGIVATPNDFGRTGTLPTQPELLDFLAGELIRGGWKLKPIHRLIMTSAAYAQNSAPDRAKESADTANATFTRRIPQRLEGEAIRDSILAVSGALDERMFGNGTKDERSKRRSIYFTVKRSQLIGSMVAFDQPEPLVSQGSRPTTTVAPQALMLMNGPQVRDWADAFAARIGKGEPSAQVTRAYSLALGRAPTSDEMSDALAFIAAQTKSYEAEKMAPSIALMDFCQVLFGLNEFSYVF